MISPEIRAEMRRLVLRLHWRIETVARRFGVHHSTVRHALESGPGSGEVAQGSILDPYKPYLVERLTEAPELTSIRLLAELRERGYPGGVAVVRRYIAKVRLPRVRKSYLRIEMEPGEQAQVDWGSFGHLRIGSHQRPLSAFAMVLSYSRALFIDFCLDQRMETFLAMHRRALEYFGGVPKRILYDNLKSVVLHHVGSTVQFNPRFLDFAGHYLFEPTAAPVRYPEWKRSSRNAGSRSRGPRANRGICSYVPGSGNSRGWTSRGLNSGRSSRHRAARNARTDSTSLRREGGKRSRWPRSLRRASSRSSPASLAAAQRALLAAYPELEQEDLGSDTPLLLGGSGWIADAIITQSFGLSASIARYRREFERARQARLSPSPF